MLFDECFSKVGRATAIHLETLRSQMAVGADPAVDYSSPAWTEARRAHLNLRAAASCVDVHDLEALRTALAEATGARPDAQRERPASDMDNATELGLIEGRRAREAMRPSSAFLNRGRADLVRLDVANRFRAPPPLTYKPNDEVGRPRTPSIVPFGIQPVGGVAAGGGRAIAELSGKRDAEIEIDCVERPRPHISVPDFGKAPPRQGLQGVQYHDSMSGRAIEAYDKRSQSYRQPCHKFSATASTGQRFESYAEPGLYNAHIDAVRPRSGLQCLRFETRPGRRPVSAPVHSGHARASSSGICEKLSTVRRVCGVPDFARTTPRPAAGNLAAAQQSDEAEVGLMDADLSGADKLRAGRSSRPTSAARFSQGLTRAQHFRGMRSFAPDGGCDGGETVGAEFLDDADQQDFPDGHVLGLRFSQVPGRESTNRCAELPARCRVEPGRPGRRPRSGESLCKAQQMSHLARRVSTLRASMSYVPMPLTNGIEPS